ncbi:MAG: response regulator [Chitinivibrionales bacterium]
MGTDNDRIIIIDDVPVVASLIEDTLQDAGFKNTHIYNNPLLALKEIIDATRPRPAVIITDYNMPEMNGMELIEKVEQRYHGIDAIIVTSDSHGAQEFSDKYPILEKDSNFIERLVDYVANILKKQNDDHV